MITRCTCSPCPHNLRAKAPWFILQIPMMAGSGLGQTENPGVQSGSLLSQLPKPSAVVLNPGHSGGGHPRQVTQPQVSTWPGLSAKRPFRILLSRRP